MNVAEVRIEGSSFAQISVRDTGKGIPESDLPFVFDRFHQSETGSSRSVNGTGIGLALAKEMVELHNGKIDVESTEDFGTTFTVSLPLGTGHLETHQTPEDSENERLAGIVYSEPSWLGQLKNPKEAIVKDDFAQQGTFYGHR